MSRKDREKRVIRYTSAKEVAEKHQAGFELATLKMPKDVRLFRFKKEGHYNLRIIPYVVGKGNPMADEGMVHYERTFYVHKGVGPENKSFCCPVKTFHRARCPVCDEVKRLRAEGADKDTVGAHYAKTRQLFLVRDLDDKDPSLQVLETNYNFGLGELIDKDLDLTDEDDPTRNFFHLQGGMKLIVGVEQNTFNGATFYKPTAIKWKPAPDLDEDLLDDAICLDDLPRESTYEEILKALNAEEVPADTNGAPKKGGKAKAAADDDDDDDEDDDTTPPPAPKKGSKPAPQAADDDDDDDDDEDDDTPPPAPAPKKGGKAKPVTAESRGLKKGSRVEYQGESCTVTFISGDGTSLTLVDEDDETYKGVGADEVTPLEDNDDDDAPPPKKGGKAQAKPAPKKPAADDDDDDDDDDGDDDDDDSPLKDSSDEDDDDDDDDEAPAPPPKKVGKKR